MLKQTALVCLDKKNRSQFGKVLLLIAMPFLLFSVLSVAIAQGATDHNHAVISYVFYDGELPPRLPEEYASFLLAFRENFKQIEEDIAQYTEEIVDGNFDLEFMNILLFALYIDKDADTIQTLSVPDYVKCFIHRELIVEEQEPILDEEGNVLEQPEPTERYEVTVLSDKSEIYSRISSLTGINVFEKVALINEVIRFLHDVGEVENVGSLAPLLEKFFELSEQTSYVGGDFVSPFADGWRQKVSSEFGSRSPIPLPDGTVTQSFHNGIDLAAPKGTRIFAVQSGTVILVQNTNVGLGNYCVIDHGGGILTVYGHTSKVLVEEGQAVTKGEMIAEVGMTGYATGNHLHLEVIENRKCINPRRVLK